LSNLLSYLVPEAAQRTPDALAYGCSGNQLSYGALLERSAQLANVLRSLGVRPGDRVGILARKSLYGPIAVHGILMSGAAYVPIDPSAPRDRVARIIADCGIRHLVSSPQMQSTLEQIVRVVPVDLHVIGAEIETARGESLSWESVSTAPTQIDIPSQNEEKLAYIMYTSGSTGEPKGMMHSHRSGLYFARMARDLVSLGAEDRLGNHAPLHFDLSTFDLFSAPLAGAATIIVTEPDMLMPASLAELIEREQLTVWYSVPYALTQLQLRGGLDRFRFENLRWILFAGEPFPSKHLAALMRRLPHVRFSNLYGPAEVNVCTYQHLEAPPATSDEAIPIGKPCYDVETLILDNHDEPTPAGEVGELCIASPGCMLGYWGKEEQSARVICRRRGADGSERLYYRSGDWVNQRSDGVLLFHGRKDRQIKIRGYRVELDEVEVALSNHPEVIEAAVFTLENVDGTLQIAAAAVLENDAAPRSEAELRQRLRATLPAYAVPARISVMARLPRTSTGKVDRRTLQAAMGTPTA